MILGQADRERVNTAELTVVTLEGQVAYLTEQRDRARRDHHDAELRVMGQIQHTERITAWGRDIAVEAGRQVADARADRDAAFRVLLDLRDALLELHTEADAAPVCRHCGHAYPCPTLAVLPSDE